MAQQAVRITLRDKRDVEKLFSKEMPDYARFAVANTASRIAFQGVEEAEDQLRREFILRNNYVVGSRPGRGGVKFQRAIPHHDIRKIESSWGSPGKFGNRDYSFLEEQEEGFIHKGPVPTKAARTGKNVRRRIRRINYLRNMQLTRESVLGPSKAQSVAGRIRHMLHNSYTEGFGLPGSNQFFYLKEGEYQSGWAAGFYQFSRNSPPGARFQFPNLRRIYTDDPSTEKRRRARKWMEISKNRITARDIERVYNEEARRAFTNRNLRRW